jgi:hypothetical protein
MFTAAALASCRSRYGVRLLLVSVKEAVSPSPGWATLIGAARRLIATGDWCAAGASLGPRHVGPYDDEVAAIGRAADLQRRRWAPVESSISGLRLAASYDRMGSQPRRRSGALALTPVAPLATVDAVAQAAARAPPVPSAAAVDPVLAGPAGQHVPAGAAAQAVRTGPAPSQVGAAGAVEPVVPAAAVQPVVAVIPCLSAKATGPRCRRAALVAEQGVVARVAADCVRGSRG